MRKNLNLSMFVLLAAALVLSACGSSPATTPAAMPAETAAVPVTGNTPQPTVMSTAMPAGTPAGTALPAGSVQLNGAGSTFQQPAMSQWAFAYSYVDPSVVINYQGTGSGAGKTAIINNTVDFAGSDSVLTDQETASGKDLQMFPILAGAVVLTYNLPEIDPTKDPALILDGKTLVGIYNATITKWNDPALVALNPGLAAKLPAKQITVVHRSDGSGTTEIFTNALTAFSSDWTAGHGTSVEWPADKAGNGIGGKGSQGVAAAVQNTPDSIGYVEYSYATSNKLPFAQLVNQAGKTITASPDSVTAAMNDFASAFTPQLTAVIVNGQGDASWPIAGYTYTILHMTSMTDCTKAQKLVAFANWFLTDSGATKQATTLGFVPLPDAVRQQVLAKLAQVTCNGQPVK
jgi:phosphate transport system substrate-binding protein